MSTNINIAVVDDNRFLIKSVCEKLAIHEHVKVTFTANNGQECLDLIKTKPTTQLILMDIEMPIKNGIETCEIIKQRYPHVKIIMLTVFDNDRNIFNAIQSGADGYLLKETSTEELFTAIQETMNGGASMTPSIALKTLKLLRNPISVENIEQKDEVLLSTREIEVLEQLSTGLNHKVIASNLFISPATVRKHIENIYKKLQVHSRIEAVEKAKKQRLI
jgi:DNA-binding NarL/FixJ family response regulator